MKMICWFERSMHVVLPNLHFVSSLWRNELSESTSCFSPGNALDALRPRVGFIAGRNIFVWQLSRSTLPAAAVPSTARHSAMALQLACSARECTRARASAAEQEMRHSWGMTSVRGQSCSLQPTTEPS